MLQYQIDVNRTRNRSLTQQEELANYTLGLVCEAGEFGDMIKKTVYHGHAFDSLSAEKELGDVLWYLANICNILGLDMERIMSLNLDKLTARYPEGFSQADSIARRDK